MERESIKKWRKIRFAPTFRIAKGGLVNVVVQDMRSVFSIKKVVVCIINCLNVCDGEMDHEEFERIKKKARKELRNERGGVK